MDFAIRFFCVMLGMAAISMNNPMGYLGGVVFFIIAFFGNFNQ